ncbi:PLD nuclease N-terminal domain-containing protein [uncultured Sunxiuqinia sp.]|uniref:PLD nuclease N-terminal domain-containing protein n=1 Tax=uncultured Sunxiuqinia sp. TaxID=1573825 RepID=UPI0037486A12
MIIVELIIVLFFLLFILILPLIALVDIFKSNFEGNSKLIWVIVVIFLSAVGALLYWLIGRKQKLADANPV